MCCTCNILSVFHSGFADYIAMEPSEDYAPFWEPTYKKAYISNIVIQFLQNNEEAAYEDLLNKIQTVVPPKNMTALSEEDLLRHAQFVVDQVMLLFVHQSSLERDKAHSFHEGIAFMVVQRFGIDEIAFLPDYEF